MLYYLIHAWWMLFWLLIHDTSLCNLTYDMRVIF